jgi:GH35 family endo-1,4-beta-xylanase
MTTYGRNAKNVGLKSKIDELDMLINSFQNSDEKDMLVELKNLREQLSKMLNILE